LRVAAEAAIVHAFMKRRMVLPWVILLLVGVVSRAPADEEAVFGYRDVVKRADKHGDASGRR
jgi:hypothetical protein